MAKLKITSVLDSARHITFGADVSINHAAVVCLADGNFYRAWYKHTVKKCVDKDDPPAVIGSMVKRSRFADGSDPAFADLIDAADIADWMAFIIESISSQSRILYLAYERMLVEATGRVVQLAQLQTMYSWRLFGSCRLRSYDPGAIKMFTAHNGSADKDTMEDVVRSRWSQDFTRFNSGASQRISEDLVDAFAISKMLHTELLLRDGTIRLKDLDHDKEREAFLKVTKSVKTNILSRSFMDAESVPNAMRSVLGGREPSLVQSSGQTIRSSRRTPQ